MDPYTAAAGQPALGAGRKKARRGLGRGAFVAAVGVFLIWFLAVWTARGQLLDSLAMQAVEDRTATWAWPAAVLRPMADQRAMIPAVILVVVVALARGRLSLAVRVAGLVVLANVATQVLKVVLPRPDRDVGHLLSNSFPSGHVTGVAAVALALTLAAPRIVRPLVGALGMGWTMAVSFSVMAQGWHRPSDVVAALCVVAVFAHLLFPGYGVARPWARMTSDLALLLACLGVVAVAWTTPRVSAPVWQDQIVELAARHVPGNLAAATATALAAVLVSRLFLGVLRARRGAFRRAGPV